MPSPDSGEGNKVNMWSSKKCSGDYKQFSSSSFKYWL